VFSASVAQRMSWASERQTTRIEDTAYCLLGIFNINMPLLYGEGERALKRLQLELLNVSNEHTIFAWGNIGHAKIKVAGQQSILPKSFREMALLARSPAYFIDCGGVKRCYSEASSPHQITNIGLSITLPTIRDNAYKKKFSYFAILDCYHECEDCSYDDKSRISI
jgi:hypothetical protein